MKENQDQISVVCKGNGVIPQLEFNPPNVLDFPPCLPYDDNVYRTLQITNHSEFDVELFNLNFDERYPIEDEIVKVYRPNLSGDVLNLDVKKAGYPFWTKLEEYYKIYKEN